MTAAIVGTFLVFFVAQHVVELGLAALNLRRAARSAGAVPPELAGAVDPETARRTAAYGVARGRLGIVHAAYGAAVTLVALFSGALPALDAALAARGVGGAHRFVLFLAALAAAGGLLDLPFALYGTFVLEERFGFNRTTLRLWLADRAKGLLLGAALGAPLLYAAYGFFALAGRAWWLWAFAFLAVVQVALAWAWPALVAPLFHRFEPLPAGELRDRLERLARDAGFRTRGLYVMDASRRSAHSNAYFTGFFRPRIVLFDTLVREMSADEAAAVLAHEIGHFRRRHVHRRLAVGLLAQLVSLAVLAALVRWPPLFRAFGFAAPSLHAAAALAGLCGGSFTFFLAPLESAVSRRHEREADVFSLRVARAPGALRSALLKLNRQNLAALDPHPWYARWYASHPPLLERLRGLEAAAVGGAAPGSADG